MLPKKVAENIHMTGNFQKMIDQNFKIKVYLIMVHGVKLIPTDLNYAKIVRSMNTKICCIISGGRNGSLFFQSLLDGHKNIIQIPGIFYADEFF